MDPMTLNSTTFFVIYSLETTKVTGVYSSTSPEFLDLVISSNAWRGTAYGEQYMTATTPSNNIYARETMDQLHRTILKARNGGEHQAIKRLVNALPLNAPPFITSPYFNHNVYSWGDEKIFNSFDRWVLCLGGVVNTIASNHVLSSQ